VFRVVSEALPRTRRILFISGKRATFRAIPMLNEKQGLPLVLILFSGG
jgi:hypothetical protein